MNKIDLLHLRRIGRFEREPYRPEPAVLAELAARLAAGLPMTPSSIVRAPELRDLCRRMGLRRNESASFGMLVSPWLGQRLDNGLAIAKVGRAYAATPAEVIQVAEPPGESKPEGEPIGEPLSASSPPPPATPATENVSAKSSYDTRREEPCTPRGTPLPAAELLRQETGLRAAIETLDHAGNGEGVAACRAALAALRGSSRLVFAKSGDPLAWIASDDSGDLVAITLPSKARAQQAAAFDVWAALGTPGQRCPTADLVQERAFRKALDAFVARLRVAGCGRVADLLDGTVIGGSADRGNLGYLMARKPDPGVRLVLDLDDL